VASEPDLPSGTADVERRGRQQLARRRWAGAAAALVVVAAGVSALSLRTPAPTVPVALPPGTSQTGDTGLAVGFPIGSAVEAVAAALPAGASLGELPMDIGWRSGGLLDVPVVTAGGAATLTIQVDQGSCNATYASVDPAAPGLTQADLQSIADAVCAEWVATGSLPVIPGGPPGEDTPDLAAQ
jgi:hypothetical protein